MLVRFSRRTDLIKTHDDIVHVIFLDFGSEIDVNLDPVLSILIFNGFQEGVEPLCTAKVTDDPSKVNLGEARRLRVVHAVHAVPDRFQYAVIKLVSSMFLSNGRNLRGEWRNTNTSTDKQNSFIVQKVLRRATKWTIDHDAWKCPVQGWVRVGAYHHTTDSIYFLLLLGIKITTEGLGECRSKVADDTNMNRDVVLLRSTAGTSGELFRVGEKSHAW